MSEILSFLLSLSRTKNNDPSPHFEDPPDKNLIKIENSSSFANDLFRKIHIARVRSCAVGKFSDPLIPITSFSKFPSPFLQNEPIFIQNVEDEKIRNILKSGVEEFNERHTNWIQTEFETKANSIFCEFKKTLIETYGTIENAIERRLLAIQHEYRVHLVEFEAKTRYYNSLIDSQNEMNEKLKVETDEKIKSLNAQLLETESQLSTDFKVQLGEARAKFEGLSREITDYQAEQIKFAEDGASKILDEMETNLKKKLDSLTNEIRDLESANKHLMDEIEVNGILMKEDKEYFDDLKEAAKRERILTEVSVDYMRKRVKDLETENKKMRAPMIKKVASLVAQNVTKKKQYEHDYRHCKQVQRVVLNKCKNDISCKIASIKTQERIYSQDRNVAVRKYTSKISEITKKIQDLKRELNVKRSLVFKQQSVLKNKNSAPIGSGYSTKNYGVVYVPIRIPIPIKKESGTQLKKTQTNFNLI